MRNEAIKKLLAVKPPKTIFVPERNITRVMIRGLVKYAEKEPLKKVLDRFGLEGGRESETFLTN